MTEIQTAKGPVDSSRLGRVLMHEHVVVIHPELHQNYPSGWEEQSGVRDSIEKLNEAKTGGVDTIVDMTVIGLGRDVERIARIAKETELNIIVATGVYSYDEVPGPWHYRASDGPDPLVELFVRDITEGSPETGVRAGILKATTDKPGVTPDVDRVLRAIAQAHRQTGVPISTHSDAASQTGLEQQRVFAEEGVDLERVVIGHCGDTNDAAYLEKLIDKGSYIGMDRFGLPKFEDRVDIVATMCERGYADRMVLSHDTAVFQHWVPPASLKMLPDWHFLHVLNDVVPALEERGVTEEQIEQMLINNPRRIFDQQGAY
jgi:phosphotriesterase-related protein